MATQVEAVYARYARKDSLQKDFFGIMKRLFIKGLNHTCATSVGKFDVKFFLESKYYSVIINVLILILMFYDFHYPGIEHPINQL